LGRKAEAEAEGEGEGDFPFSIFHLSFFIGAIVFRRLLLVRENDKWKMENEKWRIFRVRSALKISLSAL
jgi:hypothetical protein